MALQEEIEKIVQAELLPLREEIIQLREQVLLNQKVKTLSVKEVGMKLNVSPANVNYYIRNKKLLASGGRCKKITEAEFLRFAQENGFISKSTQQ